MISALYLSVLSLDGKTSQSSLLSELHRGQWTYTRISQNSLNHQTGKMNNAFLKSHDSTRGILMPGF